MSYENEISELWREWKKSTVEYEKAISEGYDVDAAMWANDIETTRHHIHIYEQAAKTNEYEEKLNEAKKQLRIKVRNAKRDGDYSWAYAYSDALNMIEYLIN